MKAVPLALLVLFAAASTASGQAPAAANRPEYALAQATVTALTHAAAIDQSMENIDRNRLGDQSGRFEATGEARRALGRAQDANALFSRPMGAPNTPVRRAATAMRAPFTQLSGGLNDAIRSWEKLDRASDENESVDLVRSSISALSNEGPWDRLAQATIAVTQALLDGARAAVPGDIKTARHFLLTSEERQNVLASLTKAFPRLSTGARGGRPAEASAGMLFDFLSQPLGTADDQ